MEKSNETSPIPHKEFEDRLARMESLLTRLRRHKYRRPEWEHELDKRLYNAKFMIKFADRFAQWSVTHSKGEPAPIIVGLDGKLVWLNREARRYKRRKRSRTTRIWK